MRRLLLLSALLLLSGCALRTGTYDLKDDQTDRAFHEGFGSYIEGEVRSPRFWDFLSVAWGLGWERGGDGETVHYSTEDSSFYYPKTTDQFNSNMYDTRLTARVFPLKSIPVGRGWRVAPYGGAGYGYFFGEVEVNQRGAYLGNDIYGRPHYGLDSHSDGFSGTFPSWSLGIEFVLTQKEEDRNRGWNWDKWDSNGPGGISLGLELRQDQSKADPPWDFSATQTILSLGFSF